jgi:hypothetical protein
MNRSIVRLAFWISILIAVAVVIRRIVALASPGQSSGPSPMASPDASFASHAPLTLAHILTALAFVILLPYVLMRRSRTAFPERLLLVLGTVVGLTAYAMSTFAMGGWTERSAILLFNTLFLYSIAKAFLDRSEEKRWLLRATGILLGIATTRPVMGIFFATRSITHLEPQQFFGLAFWIGFSLNTIAVELWLRSRDRRLTANSPPENTSHAIPVSNHPGSQPR